MTQGKVDFLIIGATPLAQLLAGLLASEHGKLVLLQAEGQLARRLSRDVDLTVAAITRPESWALLAATVPETIRLVSRIGKRAAIARLDPILFADRPAGQHALGHVRHMAAAYGMATERTPAKYLGENRDGVVFRDAALLRRRELEPSLKGWLTQCGVRMLEADAQPGIAADGSAACTLDGEAIAIGQTILADDSAIQTHLGEDMWPALLQRQTASCILTEPTGLLAAPIMYQLDGGTTLHQQSEGGILACGPGEIADFSLALGALLGPQHVFRHAGQSSFVRVTTRDGAPALGRVGGNGPDVLAGFGSVGVFMVPAMARWMCGAASPAENDWFGARLVNRSNDHRPVGDFGAQT